MRLSEILNENIKVYHGSRSEHGRFKIGHTGHNAHTFGNYDSKRYGVFFTNNQKIAAIYGDVDTYDLSLTKKEIADLDNTKILDDFIDYLGDIDNDEWQNARSIRQTWQFFDGDVGKEFHRYLIKKGYKAAVFEEFINDDNGKEHRSKTYVLLDLHRVRRNPDKNQPDLFLK